MLGGYEVQGQVTAGDGSDRQGKMGAAYNNLKRKRKRQQCKVGREEEGSCSNRPELAAFLLALRDTPIEEPLLNLCDNQSLLKAVSRWIGEGGKATLVGDSSIFLFLFQKVLFFLILTICRNSCFVDKFTNSCF